MNVLLVYFINTGCLVYPVSFTCFDSLPWSIGSQEVERMTVHYENWSKAGMTPIFKVENPVEHIQNLNWLSIWIDTYFFTKVSDFIFGLIFIMIVMMTIFYKKKRVSLNINKNIFLIFFLFFLLLLEWFFNHPALRYGGYCLIVILLFYPFSLILEKYDNSLNEKKYKFIFLILIIFSIFFIRNIFRINDEINKYSYKPVTETFYKVENKHFRIDKKFKALIKNFEMCEIGHDSCDSDLRLKVEKIFDKKYIFVVN